MCSGKDVCVCERKRYREKEREKDEIYGKIINPFRGKQTCYLESDTSGYYDNLASW